MNLLERKKMKKPLANQYENIVKRYIKAFKKKHDITFCFWVGDVVGDVCVFGDYYFDFIDVKFDIDSNPTPSIFDWYNLRLEYSNIPNRFKIYCRIKKGESNE